MLIMLRNYSVTLKLNVYFNEKLDLKKNFSEKTYLKILPFPRSPFFIKTDMAIVSCCVVTHLQWPEVKHVNNQGQESGAVGGGRWLDFWVLY